MSSMYKIYIRGGGQKIVLWKVTAIIIMDKILATEPKMLKLEKFY